MGLSAGAKDRSRPAAASHPGPFMGLGLYSYVAYPRSDILGRPRVCVFPGTIAGLWNSLKTVIPPRTMLCCFRLGFLRAPLIGKPADDEPRTWWWSGSRKMSECTAS